MKHKIVESRSGDYIFCKFKYLDDKMTFEVLERQSFNPASYVSLGRFESEQYSDQWLSTYGRIYQGDFVSTDPDLEDDFI